MISIPCPEMYCGEPVEFEPHQDSQGVDGWATTFTFWEMFGSGCGHQFNEVQHAWLDAQLDIAIADYEPDYSRMEP